MRYRGSSSLEEAVRVRQMTTVAQVQVVKA